MSGIDRAAIDTSEWNIVQLCYCPKCRQRRFYDQMSRLYPDGLSITVTLWPPRLPFEWPTTQKAICA